MKKLMIIKSCMLLMLGLCLLSTSTIAQSNQKYDSTCIDSVLIKKAIIVFAERDYCYQENDTLRAIIKIKDSVISEKDYQIKLYEDKLNLKDTELDLYNKTADLCDKRYKEQARRIKTGRKERVAIAIGLVLFGILAGRL